MLILHKMDLCLPVAQFLATGFRVRDRWRLRHLPLVTPVPFLLGHLHNFRRKPIYLCCEMLRYGRVAPGTGGGERSSVLGVCPRRGMPAPAHWHPSARCVALTGKAVVWIPRQSGLPASHAPQSATCQHPAKGTLPTLSWETLQTPCSARSPCRRHFR